MRVEWWECVSVCVCAFFIKPQKRRGLVYIMNTVHCSVVCDKIMLNLRGLCVNVMECII